jgi:predicted dehydrogenase
MTSRPTRIGLVGINERARRLLLPGLRGAPRARLAAVCSRDLAKAVATAAGAGPEVRAFTRVEEMAGSGAVDAVFVNTPPAAHARCCLAALRAGCAVVCEKPLAVDTREADALCAAAAGAGVRTAVNFTYRSVPAFRLTERLLGDPGIGRPLQGAFALLQGHNFLPDFPRRSALLDSGVHLLDTLAVLATRAGMGRVTAVSAAPQPGVIPGRSPAPVERAPGPSSGAARLARPEPEGVADQRATGAGVEMEPGSSADSGWAFLARTASGVVLTAQFSRSALGWRNGLRWDLYGEAGAIAVEADGERTAVRLARRGEPSDARPQGEWRPVAVPPDIAADDGRFPAYHLDRLVGAIRGEEPFADFGAALLTHRLADALAAAAAAGRWAPVP